MMAELDMSDRTRVSVDAMRTLMERLFIRVGVPAEDAATAVEVLVFSDVHGIDSHGIPRMRMYLNAIAAGRVNLHPKITVVMEGPATLTLDGDQGLGLVVAPFAMRRAIEKAKETGWCTVSVRASNHLGTRAYSKSKKEDSSGRIGVSEPLSVRRNPCPRSYHPSPPSW